MRPGFTISTAFHAVVLGWGLIHFATVKPNEAPPVESLPVDIVDISDITKSKQGDTKAQKQPDLIKQVDKKAAEQTPKSDPTLPIKKQDVKATIPQPTPPEEKVEKKEEPTKEVAKKEPEPSPDALKKKIEEELKKVEKKQEPPKKVVKQDAPKVKTKHKFDPDQIAAQIDRRAPSRKETAGEQKSQANFGTKGTESTASANEWAAFDRQVRKCWNVLPGAGNIERSRVEIQIFLNQDGTLSANPRVHKTAGTPSSQTTAESAIRAIINCAPYKMFQAKSYADWKDAIIGFNPGAGDY